ncbi:hypothetical protein Y032_0004g1920 [Ancylostoma ceylanicum]|uniref:Uncharacterized protein n=1 Tax=Ancylostoma ceylanicum TaxID=53326 RepID=A0A016VUT3_9BILA|nr:hypothetical protein Y032_0004g1920 [Ancylostoma ceylanicum]
MLIRYPVNFGLSVIHTVIRVTKNPVPLILDPNDVMERWRQYFGQMFNEEIPHPPILFVKSFKGPVLPVAPTGVSEAIRKMKPSKATGCMPGRTIAGNSWLQ